MRSTDPVLPLLVTRAQARRAGLSDRQITWRITHGQWQVLRRNVFVVPRPPSDAGSSGCAGPD